MLHCTEWQDYFLHIGLVMRGGGTQGWLLDHVTQEQFFETYAGPNAVAEGIREIHGLTITILSQDSFDNLSRLYQATRILIGD